MDKSKKIAFGVGYKAVMRIILFELSAFTSENLHFLLWQTTVILVGQSAGNRGDFFTDDP